MSKLVGGDSCCGGVYMAITPSGELWDWGSDQPTLARGEHKEITEEAPGHVELSDVKSAAIGNGFSLMSNASGEVYASGKDQDSQLGYKEKGIERGVSTPILVNGVSNVIQVAAGYGASYALESNGTVWAWGYDQYGELGNGTMKETETFPEPAQVKKLKEVVAIAAGLGTAYALTSGGKVWAWGDGAKGELGNGGTTSSDEPVEVAKLTEVQSLAANDYDTSMFVVKDNGTVWGWGENEHDNLGTGNTTDVKEPIEIQKLTNVTEVSDTSFNVEVLKSDGTVWSWGRNSEGELGSGTDVESLTPVQVFGVEDATAIANEGGSEGALSLVPNPAPFQYPEEVGGYNPSGPCGCGQGNSGDPVDTATGEFSERYTDLSIPGRGVPLNFERTYGSGAGQVKGLLGYGWAFSYGMSLTEESSKSATVTQENGSKVEFYQPKSGEFKPLHYWIQATLKHNEDGTWTFTRRGRTIFNFSSEGKLASEKDLNGYTTKVTYPSASEIVITDPAGRTFTLAIGEGHITSLTDSAGRKVSYKYDESGNLREVIDAGGGHTQYTYDAEHELLTIRQPKYYEVEGEPAPVLTNEYEHGKVVVQTDQIGRKTAYQYEEGEEVVTRIKEPSGESRRDYYVNGMLKRTIRAYKSEDYSTTHYYYDVNTLMLSGTCDQGGHCFTKTYDSHGNVLTETDPLGRTTEYTYDALDDGLTNKDPLGIKTTMKYDGAGNLLTRSRPLLNAKGETVATQTTEYKYGGTKPEYAGDVTSIVDPNGNTWQYRYDAYGDMVSKTAPPTPENASGNETTYGYDTATGWRTSTVSPEGNQTGETKKYTTTYEYNPFGQLIEVHDPLWSESHPTLHQETFHYDANHNLEYKIDGNGEKATYTYDPANELTETTMPNGSQVKQSYWPSSLLKYRTDGDGHTTSYEYNPLGYLSSETDPLGRTTRYSYDSSGNLIERSAPTATERYTYDAANELVESVSNEDEVKSIKYDADGHRISMTDPTGTATWKWDSLGRLTSSKDGYGNEVGYEYDKDNNLTRLTYPGGLKLQEKYDAADRMESLEDWKGNKTTFGYDANSNLTTETLPKSTKVTDAFGYDPTNQIVSVAVKLGSTKLANFSYTRNGHDDLSTATTSGLTEPNQSYSYTPDGQLETSGPPTEQIKYAYDQTGNITTRGKNATLAYDAADEPCWLAPEEVANPKCESPPTSATTYGYDESGEQIKESPHVGKAVSYAYNGSGELTNYNVGVATYLYNGEGLRLYKKIGSTTEHFVWSHTEPLPLLLADGKNDYIYGPGGQPLEQITGSTVVFLHHDQLGNTRLLTNTSGENVGSYNYDPYGTPTHTGSTTTPLQFAGGYTDSESKLVYMRGRYYNPTIGQFITRDPLANTTGAPYYYGSDNPINEIDPTGLCSVDPFSSSNCAYELAKSVVHYVENHPVADGVVLGAVAVGTGGAALVVEGGVVAGALGLTATVSGAGAAALDGSRCLNGGDTTACVGAGLGAVSIGLGTPELLASGDVIEETGAYRQLAGGSLVLGAFGTLWDGFAKLPEEGLIFRCP